MINATALGARGLVDVCDDSVFPAKGQTITVLAPNVTEYLGRKDPRGAQSASSGEQLYIIPRPGSDGLVTLGGCYVEGEWDTTPCMDRAERILREAYRLCPELAGERAGAMSDTVERDGFEEPINTELCSASNSDAEGWRRIHIISHNVGLRPCRRGGMRLELERRVIGDSQHRTGGDGGEPGPDAIGALIPGPQTTPNPRTVACIHAYGVGSAGYQMSFGVAREVGRIAAEYKASGI